MSTLWKPNPLLSLSIVTVLLKGSAETSLLTGKICGGVCVMVMGSEEGGVVSGRIRYVAGVSGDVSRMMWMDESSSGITCDDSGRISGVLLMKVVGRAVGGITIGGFYRSCGWFLKEIQKVECVLAVGSSGGLDNTVTMGIVLGLKRLLKSGCLIQNQAEEQNQVYLTHCKWKI